MKYKTSDLLLSSKDRKEAYSMIVMLPQYTDECVCSIVKVVGGRKSHAISSTMSFCPLGWLVT